VTGLPVEPAPEILIWSDYVCPWCRIATERAAWLERRFGARIEWLPYALHPEYPPEGLPRQQLLDRYGPEAFDRLREVFAEADFPYAPHPGIIPNTGLALELGEQARAESLHPAWHARTMEAYWSEGRDIGDPDVLRAVAGEVGVTAEGVASALEERAWRTTVEASTLKAREVGANAVPAFVVDRRLLVLGAQPHDVLEQAVATAREAA